jgi:photosystem II Psb27 protein
MGSQVRRIFLTLALVISLMLPGAFAEAVQLKGSYTQDGQTVIQVLRAAVEAPSEEAERAALEAQAAMDAFNGRYHGDRYDKMQSYTTLRTVFNTLASSYRVKRPLTEEKKERVLAQLRRAEAGLQTAN